jgi:predicted CoA-binding protein
VRLKTVSFSISRTRREPLGIACQVEKTISTSAGPETNGEGAVDMGREDTREILDKYRVVAVVGLSRGLSKDSNRVAKYLQSQGYRIIPVNPTTDEVLDEKSYGSLLEIPSEVVRTIEIVDIFRPSADVPAIVNQAIRMKELYDKPYVVWMQLGIINEHAAKTAREAGLAVVMNKCMMQDHRRLFQST